MIDLTASTNITHFDQFSFDFENMSEAYNYVLWPRNIAKLFTFNLNFPASIPNTKKAINNK